MQDKQQDEFYNKLRRQLEKLDKWPGPYLFKFILPTTHEKELQKLSSLC